MEQFDRPSGCSHVVNQLCIGNNIRDCHQPYALAVIKPYVELQNGLRPLLIVSPAEFNEATRLPVILPITNGGKFARRLGFAVPITSIKTSGIVRCDQPHVLDLSARRGHMVDSLPESTVDEVLARINTLFA